MVNDDEESDREDKDKAAEHLPSSTMLLQSPTTATLELASLSEPLAPYVDVIPTINLWPYNIFLKVVNKRSSSRCNKEGKSSTSWFCCGCRARYERQALQGV